MCIIRTDVPIMEANEGVIYPTTEDLQHVKMYAFLPLIHAVFNRDREIIKCSGIKTKKPYMELMNEAIQRVSYDWVQTKKFFRQNGIKVLKEQRNANEILLQYSCRGYQHTAHFRLEVAKLTVEEMMNGYLR